MVDDGHSEHNNNPAYEATHEGSYDKLTRPEVELRVPAYFMKYWGPRLSNGAALLYLQLRLMCWYDVKNPQNSRDYCWPKQETLAKLIRSTDRSVRTYLKELESRQLIQRKADYYYSKEKGKKLRGVDVYQVFYRPPLIPEHQANALVIEVEEQFERALEHPENTPPTPTGNAFRKVADDPESPTGNGFRQIADSLGFPPPTGKIEQPQARKNVPGRSTTELINNVTNVTSRTENSDSAFARDPRVSKLSPDERDRKEALMYQIGDTLARMTGSQGSDMHRSAGFHRRVAYLLPEGFINEALMATRDAVEDQRSGTRSLHTGPAAYFAGIVRQICQREGIDIGVSWKTGALTPGR